MKLCWPNAISAYFQAFSDITRSFEDSEAREVRALVALVVDERIRSATLGAIELCRSVAVKAILVTLRADYPVCEISIDTLRR